MNIAHFSLYDVAGAFKTVLKNWTPSDFGTLLAVYQRPEWAATWTKADSGVSPEQAMEALHTQFPDLAAARLITLLVGCYGLTDPERAAQGIAPGLRAIGMAPADALAALQAFFGSRWTAAATPLVLVAYA